MPKSAGKRKKTRTHVENTAEKEEYENAPKSFIIKRGKVGIFIKELIHNLRELMYPYTFINLKESKRNSMKDFLGVAGQFGVSHMMMLTQTEKSNYMRFIKNPKGPTLTFKIDEYALTKDVVAHMQETKKNHKVFSTTLQAPPLLIMNGFGGRADNDPFKICSLMIQSMFPPIKV
jgi:ribosome biogenesis protein SSF1/2